MNILKLIDIAFLNMGQSPDSSTYNSEGIGLPFFQGKKDFGKLHPEPTQYCSAPVKIAQPNDILMSVRAPVGPTNIANAECCIGRGLAAIRPNSNILDTFYLHYFFKYFETEISEMGKGSTFAAITKAELANLQIPLPPLDEQKRLVSLLDTLFAKIDRSIELLEENIAAADLLLPSALNTVFEELGKIYTKVSLSQHIEFNGGSQPPKNQFSDTELDGYIRLIQIRDYKSDAYKIYVKKTSVRKFCTKDDVMIGRYGPPVFQILRGIEGAYNVALMKADINESYFTKDYVFYFLQNPNIQNYIIGLSQRSAGQSGVNKEALEKYEIPLPPLDIQTQTVEYLDSIRTKVEILKHVQNNKIANLKALKASILDRAFKGKL